MRAALVLAAASFALTPACSGSGASTSDASADGAIDSSPVNPCESEDAARTYAPTYDAVWHEILQHNCATEFCHAGSADFLQLYNEASGYPSLLGPAQGPLCANTGLLRVDPYHPETSLVYLKVTNPPCGNRMPNIPGDVLCPRDVAQIRDWIACGALDGDAGCADGSGEEGTEGGADGAQADVEGRDGGQADVEGREGGG
jgi:hypothetical protein